MDSGEMQTRFVLAAALTLLLCLGLTSDAVGQRSFGVFLNPFEERALGERSHEANKKEFGGISSNTALVRYVESIGLAAARTSARHPDQFVFSLVNDAELNASTFPGGFVYINVGALAWVNDEAELAALIGHEVGHAVNRHYARSVARRNVGTVFLRSGLFTKALMLPYEQSQEFQADDVAGTVLKKMGLDLYATPRLINQLILHERLLDSVFAQAERGSLLDQNHPPNADRLRRAIDQIPVDATRDGLPNNRDRYLEAIDGLRLGGTSLTLGKAVVLRVMEVKSEKSIDELVKLMAGAPSWRRNYFLAINGFTSVRDVKLGARVKVLVQS